MCDRHTYIQRETEGRMDRQSKSIANAKERPPLTAFESHKISV